jgi:tRNA pseudouridine38-40 synthase
MTTRRLLAIIEYDGTDFKGFQVQKRRRTVQGEMEKALRQITGEKIRVTGAGRTDTGVHAAGLGAHFDTAWGKPLPVLHRALNAVLPTDIAIRQLAETPPDFSARFSARSRAYRYTILNQAVRSPLAERYALLVSQQLDADAMETAAQYLIGQHDFGAFGTPPQGDNTVREVYAAQVHRDGARLLIDLKANAFLYRMVRRIVGTLLLVGQGRLSPIGFCQVLEKKRRAGESVPPHGLCLIAVEYDL